MGDLLGIIGGSGFYEMKNLQKKRWVDIQTPFGKPSDQYLLGILNARPVVFLARHGRGHRFLPMEVNYRANIYGMKKLGVTSLVAASAVGSLRQEIKPLDFVILDQFVDLAVHRKNTFFGEGVAAHISLAQPFCNGLRKNLIRACEEVGVKVHKKGTYLNMEGPAFSTLAESNLYRRWELDVIGMTNSTEAKLAREAEICYATMAMVTDYDCWHPEHEAVTVEAVIRNLMANAQNAQDIILNLAKSKRDTCLSGCRKALSNAIITSKNKITPAAKKRLKLLIGKYL